MNTSCSGCVFATYEGDEQSGCRFGRLHAFRDRGATITPEVDATGHHFLIHDRVCNALRTDVWAEKQDDQTEDGLMDAAYELLRFRPAAVVYCPLDSPTDDLEASLASLSEAGFVDRLIVCFEEGDSRTSEYTTEFMIDAPARSWHVLEMRAPTEEAVRTYGEDGYLRAVDEAVKHVQERHYTAARAGFAWPRPLFENFDRAINVEMRRVVGILPAPPTPTEGYVILTAFHKKLVMGNRDQPLVDKLVEAGQYEGTSYTIGTFEEFAAETDMEIPF